VTTFEARFWNHKLEPQTNKGTTSCPSFAKRFTTKILTQTHRFRELFCSQPVRVQESMRKMMWQMIKSMANFADFQANDCSLGAEKREDMHRPDHFAADSL
jgi:hypothetical protein